MNNWIEMLREDVNKDEGAILSIFTNLTSFLFKGIVFLAIPIFLYILISFF
jgi:hypothetical protein